MHSYIVAIHAIAERLMTANHNPCLDNSCHSIVCHMLGRKSKLELTEPLKKITCLNKIAYYNENHWLNKANLLWSMVSKRSKNTGRMESGRHVRRLV
jgi:hypothetical protein